MHTVIAAFDDRQDAQRALERLVEGGFSRDMVHLQARDDAWSDSTDRPRAADESHGFFEGIRRFFARLFRRKDPGPVDATRLVPLTFAVVIVLGAMSVLLAYADIVKPITLQ